MRVAPLLLLAVLLAGCSRPEPGAPDAPPAAVVAATPPPPLDADRARTLLEEAGNASLPPRYGFRLTWSGASGDLVRLTFAMDAEARRAVVDAAVEAEMWDRMGNPGKPSEDGFVRAQRVVLGEGDGRLAAVTFVGGMALPQAPHEEPEEDEAAAFAPGRAPRDAAAEEWQAWTDEFAHLDGAFGGANLVVREARATTFDGKPAYEVDVALRDADEPPYAENGTVTVYADPVRLARVALTGPADEPDGPSAQEATFHYDNDAPAVEVPRSAERALGLAYDSNWSFGERNQPLRWTFLRSGGVPLSEAELQLKDDRNATEGATPEELPTLWSMRLSEREGEHAGLRAVVDDKDADGKVSRGDTLDLYGDNEAVRLRDAVTGVVVVPGSGVAALFAAVALASSVLAALRRR